MKSSIFFHCSESRSASTWAAMLSWSSAAWALRSAAVFLA